MISAFARAAQVLDEPRYLRSCDARGQILARKLYDEKSNCSFAVIEMGGVQWKGSPTITPSWFRDCSIFTKPPSMSSG